MLRPVAALAIALCVLCPLSWHADEAHADEVRHVDRVVDGDTVVLDGGERLRLMGVSAPESVHPRRPVEPFGEEAAAFTRERAEGRDVRIEYDDYRYDIYGRTLGYVHLPDGTMLNRLLLEKGLAQAYTRFPFSRIDEFRELEKQAKAARVGLWGATAADAEDPAGPGEDAPRASGECVPRDQCCRVCSKGRACGASCIKQGARCSKAGGCACNAADVCR
jgi:micrococcal nuclease